MGPHRVRFAKTCHNRTILLYFSLFMAVILRAYKQEGRKDNERIENSYSGHVP